MLCFVVVMQSFIMNSHEVFIHIHQGCFAGTGAIVRLPQCQWSKPAGYGKISQCITTTRHSEAKTVCIFLGIYCRLFLLLLLCGLCDAVISVTAYSVKIRDHFMSWPTNERRRYIVTSSIFVWAHTQNNPWKITDTFWAPCFENQYIM